MRLFHKDIYAVFHEFYGIRSVELIRSSDNHGLNIIPVEQAVDLVGDFLNAVFGCELPGCFTVETAQYRNFNIVNFRETAGMVMGYVTRPY
jgi:hypothetical protein